jgi:hypothetical protein
VVPITCIFLYYTVPLPVSVKAQICLRGTEKRDYRNSVECPRIDSTDLDDFTCKAEVVTSNRL